MHEVFVGSLRSDLGAQVALRHTMLVFLKRFQTYMASFGEAGRNEVLL